MHNASIIDKGRFRTRKTLEAWHSKLTHNADNNSCPLPGQYNILFNKQFFKFHKMFYPGCGPSVFSYIYIHIFLIYSIFLFFLLPLSHLALV